ncbi:MAG: wax ester/triacylglycerol synthase family O-acyltransferase [Proteobacteria bacterium]|nr:wax ester/triacylglycerol synthase family O-acyltransferase [Pseudomonadota bacterium]
MFQYIDKKKEPMRKVDTAWLRMESPHNLMMITGLMFLDKLPDIATFIQILEKKFLKYRRFKQLALQNASGSFWQDDENFDMAAHVRRVALPGRADYAELQDYVSNLASTPLDMNKPLWSFHLVENYKDGPVVVSRIHHCYADGIALIQVLLSMTSTEREKSLDVTEEDEKKEEHQKLGLLKQAINPAKKQFNQSLKLMAQVAELGKQLLEHPEMLEKGAGEASAIFEELVHALTLSDDPQSVFKSKLCTRKRVAWSQSLPLDEIKSISKATGTTINDVLIANLAGALREYMLSVGDDPTDKVIRATVPVNLRPLTHAKELGNHFGLVFLSLPIFEPNPLKRLEYIHNEMKQLKSSKQAVVSMGLLSLVGLTPLAVQNALLEQFSKKATAVLTNVPGPQVPLYIAGSKLEKIMFWVPQNGTIGMGLSILSYNGSVEFGLIVDKNLIPQPHKVIMHFPEQFAQLKEIMMLHPWDGEIHPGLLD